MAYHKKFPFQAKPHVDLFETTTKSCLLDKLDFQTHTPDMADTASADDTQNNKPPERPKLLPPQGILSFDDSDSGQNPIDGFVIGVYLDIAANGDSAEVRLRAAEALGRGRGHDAKAEVRAGKYKFGQPQQLQQNNFVFAQETTLRQLMSGIKSLGLAASADAARIVSPSAEGDLNAR